VSATACLTVALVHLLAGKKTERERRLGGLRGHAGAALAPVLTRGGGAIKAGQASLEAPRL
jgi:hypothetical protein